MPKEELGKITELTLGDIFEGEADDFTPWLFEEENLKKLGETIGLNIVPIEKEYPTGRFRLDILAEVEGNKKTVTIENQYKNTNHKHLGQSLTYASYLDSSYIIWIAEKIRPEHKNAVRWFNEHSDSEKHFFLIRPRVLKIDDSKPAIFFDIVESPNNWAEILKNKARLTNTDEFYLRFWEEFRKYNQYPYTNFQKLFSGKTPKKQASIYIKVKKLKKGAIEFFITGSKQDKVVRTAVLFRDNNELFDKVEKYKDLLERDLNKTIKFKPSGHESLVQIEENLDPNNEKLWEDIFNWYLKNSQDLLSAIEKYVPLD